MNPKNTPPKSSQQGRNKVRYVEVIVRERTRAPTNASGIIFYGKGLTKGRVEREIRQKFRGFMFAEEPKGRIREAKGDGFA